ncbi:MAG: amidohydrolase [Phycisphaerales bacterium]|nr:MAG: amidohydrolase [Phycisphaerales bacterium]
MGSKRIKLRNHPLYTNLNLFAIVCFSLTQPTRAQKNDQCPTPPADLAVVNARIWTGVEDQPSSPGEPTALAVVGERIIIVGSDEDVKRCIGPDTSVIDAKGRRVIPGITDSHVHMVSGGFQLGRLHLRNVRSREEFVEAVAAEAKAKKPGQWVLGGRWSVESWSTPESPTKDSLDPVTGNVPVFLSRMDGHQALVNSAALRLAGINAAAPPDPVGGEIERDPKTREPTGILKESAMDLVRAHIPAPSLEDRYEALIRAMRHANSLGITSVHDMSELADIEVYKRAIQEEALTLRVHGYLMVEDWLAHIKDVQGLCCMVEFDGFKGFMDGSLGSRTAYMREPYADAPSGMPYPQGQLTAMAQSPHQFQSMVDQIDALGFQIAVHAIGDEANHLLLDAYATAIIHNKRRPPLPHRVEHAQHLRLEDIPRFARLGVVASMQPFHKADDGRYAEQRLGKERLKGSYAYRKLLDAGAMVCFGSDWPVATMNPFEGMAAAVNARTLGPTGDLDGPVWLPDHALSVNEALSAYTVWPTHVVGTADRLGTLELGKIADLVILSADPLGVPPTRLSEIQAAITIVGGKVVFSRPSS